MKLSFNERWLLSNQYLILELLDKENAKSYRNAREALDCGYEIYYRWLSEHIYDDTNTLPKADCQYVLDVMDMFDSMQHAYDQLSDKSGVEPRSVVFPGFDGNNESKYMAFARFFCEDRGAFELLRKGSDGFNSHMPTRDLYGRMMAAWNESKDKRRLTKDDLIRITRTAIHPDYRDEENP